MQDIDDFIKFCLENTDKINTKRPNYYGDESVYLDDFLEIAKVIYNEKNREELIIELCKIKDFLFGITLGNISYAFNAKEHHVNLLKNIEWFEEYKGFWNKNYFMELYNLSEKDINRYVEKSRKENFPTFAEIAEKNQQKIQVEKENKDLFKRNYDEKKNNIEKIKLDKYENEMIPYQAIDIMNVHYPIIILFYKDEKVISINKSISNLSSTINSVSNKKFDSYKIVHATEDIIDDLIIEFKIKYHPIYMGANIINNIKKVYKYRTIKQVNEYYKDKYHHSAIKKIIRLYNIPIIEFDNGAKIINRYELEKAIERHLKENK